MDKELTYGQMEENMKESFKILKYMVEENMNGKMVECKYFIS